MNMNETTMDELQQIVTEMESDMKKVPTGEKLHAFINTVRDLHTPDTETDSVSGPRSPETQMALNKAWKEINGTLVANTIRGYGDDRDRFVDYCMKILNPARAAEELPLVNRSVAFALYDQISLGHYRQHVPAWLPSSVQAQ